MYLAKLEIIKGEIQAKDIPIEKTRLTVFSGDLVGKAFMTTGIEDFEKRFDILSSFNYHGDTYFFVEEKGKRKE